MNLPKTVAEVAGSDIGTWVDRSLNEALIVSYIAHIVPKPKHENAWDGFLDYTKDRVVMLAQAAFILSGQPGESGDERTDWVDVVASKQQRALSVLPPGNGFPDGIKGPRSNLGRPGVNDSHAVSEFERMQANLRSKSGDAASPRICFYNLFGYSIKIGEVYLGDEGLSLKTENSLRFHRLIRDVAKGRVTEIPGRDT